MKGGRVRRASHGGTENAECTEGRKGIRDKRRRKHTKALRHKDIREK